MHSQMGEEEDVGKRDSILSPMKGGDQHSYVNQRARRRNQRNMYTEFFAQIFVWLVALYNFHFRVQFGGLNVFNHDCL